MPKPLSARLARALISYNPQTGEMAWKPRPVWMFARTGKRTRQHTANAWNAKHAGSSLTTKNKGGYIKLHIFYRFYGGHRIAWLIHTGKWPDHHIDHINGDPADNRFANLRAVSFSENMRNVKRNTRNTSGHTGVYWLPRSGKWGARINHNKKTISLGSFENKQDAIAARARAERQYGFHPNHGRAESEGERNV